MLNRPQLLAPLEIFYDDSEAWKYTSSSRIIDIQARLSERALELLALPFDGIPRLLLDIAESRTLKVAFFGSLYRCLAKGARAVFQVYPENIARRELILRSAMHAGFAGGVVIDYPHSKSRKEYPMLTCGPPSLSTVFPWGEGEDGESCSEDDNSEKNQMVCISDRNRLKKKQKITRKGKGRD
ncbi:18S rRNA (guanine-N(7))-methyltransferase RID2 isoform X3 [Populus alba x Populus x berolinensis]|nr:18S rRNA (guanine-N(7))-methyltransferase RID2 isoform X3 [Populus alba x Populus x berolinensis]